MIKVIACAIYKPYIVSLPIDFSKYDIQYLEIHQHNHPKQLSKNIQKEIDQTKEAEKIIILYGLCGNALLDIKAREIAIDVIKVHDCLSILLGSKKRYQEIFKKRLSSSWSCYGLKQNDENVNNEITYQEWIKKYDQETAEYLKQYLQPIKEVYISFGLEDEQKHISKDKEVIMGSLDFLEAILLGKSKDIITLQKGEQLVNSYDFNEVFKKI